MQYARLSKNALHRAVVFGSGIVDRKAEGAYANLFLRLQRGHFIIEANGAVASSEIEIPIENCEDDFEFSCRAGLLDDQLKTIDTEILTIEQTEILTSIKGDRVRIDAPLLGFSKTRPIETESPLKLQCEMDLQEFGKKLKIIHKATFEGPADGITSNIYISDGEMRASDDCKYYCTDFPSKDSKAKGMVSPRLSLPKKGCGIVSSFAEISPRVELFESDDIYVFKGDGARLCLIKSVAPPLMTYERMLQDFEFFQTIQLKRDAMLLAAKRAYQTADRQNPEMRFRSKGKNLVVISEISQHVTTQQLGTIDREISLNINPKDILEFLTPIDSSEDAIVQFGSSITPIGIKIEDFRALIMPYKAQSACEQTDDDIPF